MYIYACTPIYNSVHACIILKHACMISLGGVMTGLNLKIHAVDVPLGFVRPAVKLRAEQRWTVAELKEAIAKVVLYIVLCIQ